eukprot:scaffold99234_cov62-Attheya_sp.AAC.2
MVVFGSGLMVGATFDLHFFAQEQANFCALTVALFGVRGTSYVGISYIDRGNDLPPTTYERKEWVLYVHFVT